MSENSGGGVGEDLKNCIKGCIKSTECFGDKLDYKVYDEQELIEDKNSLVIFVWKKKHEYRRICNRLNGTKGFEHVEFCVWNLMYYKDNEKQFLEDRKFNSVEKIVPRILVLLTHVCTLRCKHCAMLVPQVENPSHRKLEDIIQDIDVFLRGINKLRQIGLTGGEVFIYPYLEEILKYLIQQNKIERIELLTNGTIVPKTEIMELLQNKKIYVRISDYGQFEKMSKLVVEMEKYNINFDVCTDMTWWDAGDCSPRNKSDYEKRSEFMNCGTGDFCKMLLNGKFYGCERAARMEYMKKYESSTDYVELLETDSDEAVFEKIENMYKLQVMDACDYCDLSKFPHQYVKTAEQIDRDMAVSEYTIISRKRYQNILKDLPYTPYW